MKFPDDGDQSARSKLFHFAVSTGWYIRKGSRRVKSGTHEKSRNEKTMKAFFLRKRIRGPCISSARSLVAGAYIYFIIMRPCVSPGKNALLGRTNAPYRRCVPVYSFVGHLTKGHSLRNDLHDGLLRYELLGGFSLIVSPSARFSTKLHNLRL